MKRYSILCVCVLLCAVMLGCSAFSFVDNAETVATVPTEPAPHILPADYTFPRGTDIFGADVGSMTPSEACAAANAALQDYTIHVSVNGASRDLEGSDYHLSCTEEVITAYATALDAGEDTEGLLQVTYSEPLLQARLSRMADIPAQNATIVFNEETKLYELVPGAAGKHVDVAMAATVVGNAIRSLRPSINIRVAEYEDLPTISETSPQAIEALEDANNYLNIELTYNFTLDDGGVHSETLSQETLVSLLAFDKDLNRFVKSAALRHYIEDLNEKYGYRGVEGQFTTNKGVPTEFTVLYYAQALDMDALHEDMRRCLESNRNRTRFAPYLDTLIPSEIPYDGNYIEIDLSSQCLWLYQDGECILKTDIVTGCVANYWNTPTGVYDVNLKRRGAILVGADYETYVSYWMPFYRGYGLHDAYWRGRFGGNEYLYNGSHGCVNIPSENAKFIFNTISVGYPVILYGGATNKGPLQQSILGTDTYDTTIHTEPFLLDAFLAYGNSTLTYTSSDPSVATVAEDGTVTVHRTGSTQITVEFEETRYYTGATLEVTVNVEDPCGKVHTFGPWQQTKSPSCAEGEVSRVCEVCTKIERVAIPAIAEHIHEEWSETIEPDCVDGEESSNCTVCGFTATRVLPAEHSFRSWRQTTDPTCTTPGENTRVCRWCSFEETEVVPASGHDFSDDEEFCDDCDAKNPSYIPPKEEDDE